MESQAHEQDWFDRIRAIEEVQCPSCDHPLDAVDLAEAMRCPACSSALCIGISATNARLRVWLGVTLFGLASAVGFTGFIFFTMLHDLGSRALPEFTPMFFVGIAALVGLALVLKFNRRLERAASRVRTIIVAGGILAPILAFGTLLMAILFRF